MQPIPYQASTSCVHLELALTAQASTYKAALFMDMVVQRADGLMTRITRRMGSIPIMVKSAGCYLRDLDRRRTNIPAPPS